MPGTLAIKESFHYWSRLDTMAGNTRTCKLILHVCKLVLPIYIKSTVIAVMSSREKPPLPLKVHGFSECCSIYC